MRGYVLKYFMETQLVLISKYGTSYPPIKNTRSISIFSAIAKLLELSILNRIYKPLQNCWNIKSEYSE